MIDRKLMRDGLAGGVGLRVLAFSVDRVRLGVAQGLAVKISLLFLIVTVPTPIDEHKRPDLTPLLKASETIGKVLKRGDIVIYESTVYPGATEEDCVPVLEKISGLTFNKDFYAGYSPERINPADKVHRLPKIVKVTSGSTPETADKVDALYGSIITAGTHKAPSIRVAEAAKVIENTQRDVNIALVNELALIFNKLGIDTHDVLDAAGTKWNFLPFRPGLVGGHCIGVDPYYLTQKAESVGYHPEVVLAGRRINDGMGEYVVSRTVRGMIEHDIPINPLLMPKASGQFYESLGCVICTTPIRPGEPKRAGRWRWQNTQLEENKKECGLHFSI